MALDFRFFGQQATRLIRTAWKSAVELSEELYAMARSKEPIVLDVPLILRRTNDDIPAIQILDFTDGSTSPIQITSPPNSQLGGVTFGNNNSTTTPIDPGPYPQYPITTPTTQGTTPGGGGPVVVQGSTSKVGIGTITGGSGENYTCNINWGSTTETAPVKQNPATADPIPPGTKAIVIGIPTGPSSFAYHMAVATWLPPP